ncbi:MAG: hypothetical protein II889_12570 [Clostridia bacterium]|nr:hypothetical protein [Clostridia bacterium]
MKVRIAWLCLLTAVLLLVGCGKQKEAESPAAPSNGEVLTGIFTAQTVPLDADWRMCHGVLPYWNGETVEAFCQIREEREVNGEIVFSYRSMLCSFTAKGELAGWEEVSLPDHEAWITHGAVTEDAVYVFLSAVGHDELVRIDRADGAISSADVTSAMGQDSTGIRFFAEGGEGRFFASDGMSAAVYDDDLVLLTRFSLPSEITSMARGADGQVWAVTRDTSGTSSAVTIGTDGFGREIPFPDDGRHTLIPAPAGIPLVSFFYENGEAICSARTEQDGVLAVTQIMRFVNSGIASLGSVYDFGVNHAGLYASAMLAEDLFLAVDWDGAFTASPILWEKAADINPNEIKTITLAHTVTLPPRMISQLTAFNRSHPEAQIVPVDYTAYIDPDSLDAQEAQLVFDILNGGFRPDIVVTSADPGAPLSERRVPVQLTEKKLTVDLTPYLLTDEEINFDTLFGCVPRLFDDGEGGIWGITPRIRIDTLLLSPAWTDSLNGAGRWSSAQMFSFFDSLPDGAEGVFMENQSWFSYPWNILPRGYIDFMGEAGEGFGSDGFLAYLSYLKDLPKDLNVWYGAPHGSMALDYRAKEAAFRNGEIAADRVILNAMADSTVRTWYREGWVPVGFPASGFSGIRVSTDTAFAITAFSDDPDLCFEAIKAFFAPGDYDFNNSADIPLPSTKPLYLDIIGAIYGEEEVSNEGTEWFFELLEGAGVPYLTGTPQAVHDIVVEEISEYLGGRGTAEDCAAKISSRVGLWAAERQ